MKLKIFDKPDASFFFSNYESTYYIYEGDEYFCAADTLENDELEEWANKNDLFDGDEEYLSDGIIDYESIRDRYREWELDDNSPTWAYPSGRAYDYFSELDFDFPSEIEIYIFESEMPGKNTRGVQVQGYDSLVRLQSFLLSKGIEVNFEENNE